MLSITFPFLGAVRFYDAPPEDVIKNKAKLQTYLANIQLWSGTIPEGWIRPLKHIQLARKRAGLTEAMNIQSALLLLIQNSRRARRRLIKLGIRVNAGANGEYDSMFASFELLHRLIDAVLHDPVMLDLLKPIAKSFIPFSSNTDYDYIPYLLSALGMDGKYTVLDAGCGDGKNITRLALSNPEWDIVAVDACRYEQGFAAWESPPQNLQFEIAEIETMGQFADQKFDVVILGAVCGHLNAQRLAIIVQEIARVLKVGGVLIATPQEDPQVINYMDDPFLTYAAYLLADNGCFDKVWP
jgi:SAM-dependent methyltransferase